MPWNIQFVSLPAIAQIERALRHPCRPSSANSASPRCFKFRKVLLRGFHRIARQHHRSRIIAHRIGQQNADRRKRAGHRGNQHRGNAQSPRQRTSMQRPAAAKSHQRKLARVVAALDRDDANRLLHLRLDHAKNARGKLFDASSSGPFCSSHDLLGPLADQVARLRRESSPDRAVPAEDSHRSQSASFRGQNRLAPAPRPPTPAPRATCRRHRSAQSIRRRRRRYEYRASARRSARRPRPIRA